MTAPKVRYAIEARREINDLYVWIAVETGPNAAEAVMRRLNRAILNLATFPLMGRLRAEVPGSPRTFAVHPWVLVYEPLTGERGIHLLRLVDGRRDLDALLVRRD